MWPSYHDGKWKYKQSPPATVKFWKHLNLYEYNHLGRWVHMASPPQRFYWGIRSSYRSDKWKEHLSDQEGHHGYFLSWKHFSLYEYNHLGRGVHMVSPPQIFYWRIRSSYLSDKWKEHLSEVSEHARRVHSILGKCAKQAKMEKSKL